MRDRMVRMVRRAMGMAAMFGLALLTACTQPAPEAALRERVASLQDSIERRDAADLAAVVADDFIGPGGLDRDGARRMAQASFLRYRNVGLELGPLDVEVRGDGATVRFTAMLRGGEGVLPRDARIYDVRTGWRREGGDWELVNAQWEPKL